MLHRDWFLYRQTTRKFTGTGFRFSVSFYTVSHIQHLFTARTHTHTHWLYQALQTLPAAVSGLVDIIITALWHHHHRPVNTVIWEGAPPPHSPPPPSPPLLSVLFWTNSLWRVDNVVMRAAEQMISIITCSCCDAATAQEPFWLSVINNPSEGDK